MTGKQAKRGKEPYILTRKDRSTPLNVSKSDHFAVKWWANRQNITLTEALHDMIHAFIEPRLAAMRRQALEDRAVEQITRTESPKKPRRIPLLGHKRS